MTLETGRKTNALKHGGYYDLFLPGEDVQEFESLLQDLTAEWKPNGALENHAVLTLAQCIWQKRRVEHYFCDEATWIEEHQEFERIDFVDGFFRFLEKAPNLRFAIDIIRLLPEPFLDVMLEQVGKREHTDEKEEIRRLKKRLEEFVLIHEHKINQEKDTIWYKGDKAARMRELIAKKIAIEERLEATIDKTIKRLAQLKTFKQVIEVQATTSKTVKYQG
jgi:hypothetical protein